MMLAQLVSRLTRFVRRDFLGLHIGDKAVFVLEAPYDDVEPFQRRQLTAEQEGLWRDVGEILAQIKGRLNRWMHPVLFVCVQYGEPVAPERIRAVIAESLPCVIFLVDYRTCILWGAGVKMTGLVKQIAGIVTDRHVHLFLLFGGGFYHEVTAARDRATDLNVLIERQLVELRDRAGQELPESLRAGDLDQEAMSKIEEGWKSSFAEKVYLVCQDESAPALLSRLAGHPVVELRDAEALSLKGFQQFLRATASPKNYRMLSALLSEKQ